MATNKFVAGNLVLVDYPGSGFWPCQVSGISSENWRHVEYFGGGDEIGEAHVQVIRDYDEATKDDLEEFIPKEKMDKDPVLRQAVEEINQKLAAKKTRMSGIGVTKRSETKKVIDTNETMKSTGTVKLKKRKNLQAPGINTNIDRKKENPNGKMKDIVPRNLLYQKTAFEEGECCLGACSLVFCRTGKAMDKPSVPWNSGCPDVPEGWKTKTMKDRRMFMSPSGEVFLGQVAVLQHLVAVGAKVDDVMKVEKEVTGAKRLEQFWCRDKEFPDGWMVRPVCGLGQSKERSIYVKSPRGRVFLGTKTEIEVTDDQEERNGTFSQMQLEILELAYNQWPSPSSDLVNQLAQETGIKPDLVVEWFWKKNASKIEQCKNNLVKGRHSDKDQSTTKDLFKSSMNSKARAPKSTFKMSTTPSKRRLPADTLKLLMSSFKLDPECPSGEKLDQLEASTGMTRLSIKRWFSNRHWRLANRNDALPVEGDKTLVKSKKVSFTKMGTKSSSKRDQHHWIKDPTLPKNWTCCNINGSLMFKSAEGDLYSSRMEVIKSFHSV